MRSPGMPERSAVRSHDASSSRLRPYRSQASSKVSRPPWTTATTSALRRTTQRRVSGQGRVSNVSGSPKGPITDADPNFMFPIIAASRQKLRFKKALSCFLGPMRDASGFSDHAVDRLQRSRFSIRRFGGRTPTRLLCQSTRRPLLRKIYLLACRLHRCRRGSTARR